MKFTLSWLQRYLHTEAPLSDILDTLTAIGLEVEQVDDPRIRLAPFRAALVLKAELHPNADRLRVCQVDPGDGRSHLQIVCGAPNVRAGMKAVLAPVGSIIPETGVCLTETVIRGITSQGMLVSERELCLSDEHKGIIELGADAPIGKNFIQIAGLDDPIIDIAVTPNRPDCLGVQGIARDLAAAGIGVLNDPLICPVEATSSTAAEFDIYLRQRHLCPAFALRRIDDVCNGQSPDWMRRLLRAVGHRSINALVDITNFMTLDRCRPLHVFDAAKIEGKLTVRLAHEGETLLALDGREYLLDSKMLVIADAAGPLSLAGVMGGMRAACSPDTSSVIIESALFDPLSIAATGRKLGLLSEARHRFERGLDPTSTKPGLEIASRLVLDICGGVAGKIYIEEYEPFQERYISFNPAQVERLSGIKVPLPRLHDIFSALGLKIGAETGTEGAFTCAIPSWRSDIHGQADLVEEIIRIVGVNQIPSSPLPRLSTIPAAPFTQNQARACATRLCLASRSMMEVMTWSFIATSHAARFGGGDACLQLLNPLSPDMSCMRPALLPGLISAAIRNMHRGYPDLALFEVGSIYRGTASQDQLLAAAGIRSGISHAAGLGRYWGEKNNPADALDVKADVLAVLETLDFPSHSIQVAAGAPPWFHPGRSGIVTSQQQNILACFGELHPDLLVFFDSPAPLVGFEIFLETIPSSKERMYPASRQDSSLKKAVTGDFIKTLQPVRRDFAFFIEKNVSAGDLIAAAAQADKTLITEVRLVDIFQRQDAPDGKISLAIEVTIQPREKTLTDPELEALSEKVIAAVQNKTGGSLRGPGQPSEENVSALTLGIPPR